MSESAESLDGIDATELEKMQEAAKQRKPYTFVLRYPVKFGSEEIRELVFNRPTIADMRRFSFGGNLNYGDLVDFAARMCKRDPQLLNGLDIEDGNRLVVVAGFFSGLGLKTGGP